MSRRRRQRGETMSISNIAARVVGGVSLAAALLLGPGVARAGPHFNQDPVVSGVDSKTGDITVTWTEEGMGTSGNAITYDFTAGPVTFTWQCSTKSGNQPQGTPNST